MVFEVFGYVVQFLHHVFYFMIGDVAEEPAYDYFFGGCYLVTLFDLVIVGFFEILVAGRYVGVGVYC